MSAAATKPKYPDSVTLRVKVPHKQWSAGAVVELGVGEAYERRRCNPGVFEPEGTNKEGFLAFEKAVQSAPPMVITKPKKEDAGPQW